MKVTRNMARAFIGALYEREDPRSDDAVLHALEVALANVPEPSRLDNVEDFAGDLVCKYHAVDRGYGKYAELKSKMVNALLFVVRLRDGCSRAEQEALSTGGARIPASGELPGWVEELANKWEERACALPVSLGSSILQDCVTELRAHAKEASR